MTKATDQPLNDQIGQMGKKIAYPQLLNMLKPGPEDPADGLERLYHFTGEDDFLKEEAWRKIAALLVPEELKSFNLDLMYGAEISADQIINQASTSPVNAKKRVVVVFDLPKLSAFSRDVLLTFLPKIPDSVCLILLSPKITESGKRAEEGAAQMLVSLVGTDLAELAAEIDKLVTYVGENKVITSSDVEAAVGMSRTHTVFQLIDSIGEKDTKKALLILRSLTLAGERPGGIIFWLTEHLERLILTKEFSSRSGGSLASFLKLPPFLASKCQKQAPNFTPEQLEKGIMLLYRADVDSKSNLMPDKILLELLTYNLCHL